MRVVLVVVMVWSVGLGTLYSGCGTPAEVSASPESEDRVGYELLRVFEVAGRQGIACDGIRYYNSGSTSLHLYSKDGELLLENTEPFVDLEKPANHIGDVSVHGGELYAGIEWFEDGRGTDIQIAVYDAETLRYEKSVDWEPESGQVEVSALAVDTVNGVVWMTDWVDGTYIYRYDMVSDTYDGKLHLRPVPQWQQGIAALSGHLYITADDGDAEEGEVDNLWRVNAETDGTAAYVTHEKAFTEFRMVGEIEGIDFDRDAGEMLVLANRGKRIVLGMPKGLYPGYEKEIHEVYVYRIPEQRR
jgi:hypothetical protein